MNVHKLPNLKTIRRMTDQQHCHSDGHVKEAVERREPLTLFLRVADLGWDILNFQSPFPFSFFSPAVDGHEFPVCEPLIGEIQQSAIGNAALESEGPVWGARQLKEDAALPTPGGRGQLSSFHHVGSRDSSSGGLVGKCLCPLTLLAGCFQSLTAEAHSH